MTDYDDGRKMLFATRMIVGNLIDTNLNLSSRQSMKNLDKNTFGEDEYVDLRIFAHNFWILVHGGNKYDSDVLVSYLSRLLISDGELEEEQKTKLVETIEKHKLKIEMS